jgi:hypothetical protein
MGISSFPVPESGIPSGNTAGRPANPVIGDTYYDGTVGFLVIFDGTNFIPCSAPAASPTIAVADVGTGIAYGSAQGSVTFTAGTSGGKATGFTVSSSTGGYSATTTGTTATITVGNNGSWIFSATAYNGFGTSPAGPTVTQTLTTVPQAPTIGTASTAGGTVNVTVTWTLGNDGGKNLSAITITPYLNGTTAQTSQTAATTSSTSHTFTGLTQGSSYTFKVKATNANGTGLESVATNSVTIPSFATVDYVVVAGGAGGGGGGNSAWDRSGGGGAGGLRSTVTATGGNGSLESALTLSTGTNYSVSIGAGGGVAASGTDSTFSNITSTGGGAGGNGPQNGGTGGSGGGGGGAQSNTTRTGGAGTANQGFAGGYGGSNTNVTLAVTGGGGGGAGSVGGDGNFNGSGNAGGGNGGDARSIDITGSSVSYAGGGGGAHGGTGGTNGGNGSTANGGANNGSANSGSGGGGGNGYYGGGGGGGGSGTVILRYPSTFTMTVGAGLTATTNTSGNNKVTKFNAGSGNVSIA